MFNLKPHKLTDEDRINRLRDIFNQCDIHELQGKKLKGLLYDMLPYDTGLKTRIELMGQSGYLEKLKRSNAKDTRVDGKIEKWSDAFAEQFGFTREASLQTFFLCAKAYALPLEALRVIPVNVVTQAKGNFSKKHMSSGDEHESSRPTYTPTQGTPKNTFKQHVLKALYYGYIIAFVAVAIILLWHSNGFETLKNISISTPLYEDVWVFGTLLACVFSILLTWGAKKYAKKDLLALYPFLIAFIHLLIMGLYQMAPEHFEKIYVTMCFVLVIGFMLTKKHAKHVLDYLSYYASALVLFGSQYLIRFLI